MNHQPHPYYPRGTFENRDIAKGDRMAMVFCIGVVVGIVTGLIWRWLT